MHQNRVLLPLLEGLDLGSSVAEEDTLLREARVETSAFNDLLNDRVDLIPGTKGSGKSSLFRIFVDFIPDMLLDQRKVVIAHGVQASGDPVFHIFSEQFSKLTEREFISFWCVYLVSLAHEQFIKSSEYSGHLSGATTEIKKFREVCARANIPEIKAERSLKDIIGWSLHIVSSWRPKVTVKPEGIEVDLFGTKTDNNTVIAAENTGENLFPKYLNEIQVHLEAILKISKLSLWLMVDRLDEIFQRRSEVERKALRGLLYAMRYFSSPSVRVKIFLRDDMLEEVVADGQGFTALTHVTARQADTLRWTEDQILAMVLKRFIANSKLVEYLNLNLDKIEASATYRKECFYKIFPPTVFKGSKQSPTMRWIYNRCADGRGVVTPRDVLDLLLRASQKQQDICSAEPEGKSDCIINSDAIQYGYEELSKRKRDTYLRAEFPHLWQDIENFFGGKTDYNSLALQDLLGSNWQSKLEDLLAIGFFSESEKKGQAIYSIPFLYRHAMKLTQGSA